MAVNIDLVERAAVALRQVLPEITFVGGATVALWLSDAAAAGARPTNDVITLVDGRAELATETCESPPDLRRFVADEITALLSSGRFQDALPGYLRPDLASQQRLEVVVLPRLRALAAGA